MKTLKGRKITRHGKLIVSLNCNIDTDKLAELVSESIDVALSRALPAMYGR